MLLDGLASLQTINDYLSSILDPSCQLLSDVSLLIALQALQSTGNVINRGTQ